MSHFENHHNPLLMKKANRQAILQVLSEQARDAFHSSNPLNILEKYCLIFWPSIYVLPWFSFETMFHSYAVPN